MPSAGETKVQQSRFRSERQDKDPEWRHGPHHHQEVGASTALHQVQVKEEMTGAFLWREKERPGNTSLGMQRAVDNLGRIL